VNSYAGASVVVIVSTPICCQPLFAGVILCCSDGRGRQLANMLPYGRESYGFQVELGGPSATLDLRVGGEAFLLGAGDVAQSAPISDRDTVHRRGCLRRLGRSGAGEVGRKVGHGSDLHCPIKAPGGAPTSVRGRLCRAGGARVAGRQTGGRR
jgi:hypothetical protein